MVARLDAVGVDAAMVIDKINLAAGLLIGALIAGGVQQLRVNSANKHLQAARADLIAMQTQRDGALAAADQCSEQVAQLQLLAAERARAATEARRLADIRAGEHDKRADAILGTQLGADPCKGASSLLRQWYQHDPSH